MQLYPVLLTVVAAAGFAGRIVGIPEDALQAQTMHRTADRILNGLNFQLRFTVQVHMLDGQDETHNVKVNRDYRFEVKDLLPGEYELIVDSHDFNVENGRFRLLAGYDSVVAYNDFFGTAKYNTTSGREVDLQRPLEIAVEGYKEYYEKTLDKIQAMIMNSPFGFIFRNRLYTVLFAISVTVMAAPYVIPWILPDLAQQMEEIKQEAHKKRAADFARNAR